MEKSFLYIWILSQLNYFVTTELTIIIRVPKKKKRKRGKNRQTQFISRLDIRARILHCTPIRGDL